MKKVLLSLLALCVVPTIALAVDCPNCEMGIYDSPAMVQNWGVFSGAQKTIHLGVKFDPAVATGLAGVEFSVLGMTPTFLTIFTASAGANVVLGDVNAPADLQDATGGGLNVSWPTCQSAVNGQFVFGTVNLIALGAVPDDVVLTVHRKYPSTNAGIQFALFNQCDAPFYTATGNLKNGCFVINPTLPPGSIIGGCELSGTSVEHKGWSALKALYR